MSSRKRCFFSLDRFELPHLLETVVDRKCKKALFFPRTDPNYRNPNIDLMKTKEIATATKPWQILFKFISPINWNLENCLQSFLEADDTICFIKSHCHMEFETIHIVYLAITGKLTASNFFCPYFTS